MTRIREVSLLPNLAFTNHSVERLRGKTSLPIDVIDYGNNVLIGFKTRDDFFINVLILDFGSAKAF